MKSRFSNITYKYFKSGKPPLTELKKKEREKICSFIHANLPIIPITWTERFCFIGYGRKPGNLQDPTTEGSSSKTMFPSPWLCT